MFQILLYSLISPIIWFLPFPIALLFKKARERLLQERAIWKKAVNKLKENSANKKVIVFHAASAGEFEQLKPLLPLIDRDNYFIFQTFSSPTVYRKECNSELFDAVSYHPLDSFLFAFQFFKKIKPAAYVLNRHDLWPAHLFAAKLIGVKSILINANMHEKSGRYFFPFRPLNRWMFESLNLILCGSQRIENGLKRLAPKANVIIAGETRFDQVIQRKENNLHNHFEGNVLEFKNIVLGSIIPSDYDVLFKGIRDFINKSESHNENFKIIAVPHEVADKDIKQLESKLMEFDFTFHRYSNNRSFNNSDVLIIDTVGILAELYYYAYCAYVGAGFGAGVHNVIEPAVYGVPTFFGPNIHILDEAVAMYQQNVATMINSDTDVFNFLTKIKNKENYLKLKDETLEFVNNTASSAQSIIDKVLENC